MVKLLVAVIPAVLVVAIAILSVQNATPLSITFLRGSTVAFPVGLWLAFAFAFGMALTAILMSLFSKNAKRL
ncbi:MAG: lipopolysaccharide assembly protein LapA domain-containing protein [Phormidesmis sp.]